MLAQTHLEVSREFIVHAGEQLALGNSLQASEKGWGAAAHAVKAIAERRGWRHKSHRDLYRAINRISAQMGRKDVLDLFRTANALHQNFYEGWMEDENIDRGLTRVTLLLDILDEAA